MGIFNFFKKEIKLSTDNKVLGPTYLEGLTEHIKTPKNLQDNEWRRTLKSRNGESKFRIKYYGQLHPEYNIIMQTDFAPILVYAEAVNTKETLLIFDGCKHGYNAMFCDKFSVEQLNNRSTNSYYQDKAGNKIFEVSISTQNGIDYDDEFGEEVDENGRIELINGSKVDFETAKRNGFDSLLVNLINEQGKRIECISEELA